MLALLTNLPSAYLAAQLKDGLVVMVLGMLVVFLFLIILIGAIKVMSKVLGRKVCKTGRTEEKGGGGSSGYRQG